MSLLTKEVQRLRGRAEEKEVTDNRFRDHMRKYVRRNMEQEVGHNRNNTAF